MNNKLSCDGSHLDLSSPKIMGILNVTPDSFSDGGKFNTCDAAIEQAFLMAEQGASIIDIGGESTRPGASAVTTQEEIDRVVPVIEALKSGNLAAAISVDTSKPEVMKQAVAAGAGLINDVRALQEPGALDTVASLDVPVCLMHMQGEPRSMQKNPQYGNVVKDIVRFFTMRIEECRKAGIARSRLLIDPGFGFGKALEHNLSLLKHLHTFKELGLPVLVGISRKSMIGAILDKEVNERLIGSISAASIAMMNGADIIRVHDVAETMDALKVCSAVLNAK